jgi:acetyltransferase-like isoleucine patch superfamily enzyme
VGAIISSNSRVVIGDYVFIAHEVVIADTFASTPDAGSAADEDAGSSLDPPTKIVVGENVWIGARAVLLSGCIIGDGAIVGAATVVDFEVPPYAVVAGNPARIVGQVK